MTTKSASGLKHARIGPLNEYKLPSAAEIAVAVLFLVAWLFPVIASWAVTAFGRRFSLVAPHWQNQNVDIVGICILVALASGVFTTVVALTYLNKMPRYQRPNILMCRINGAQRFFLVAVSLIAAVGLFKSFGGTMFDKSYGGPSVVWLGYGAWSVTFLLAVNLLVGDFLATRPFRPVMAFAMVFVLSVIFLPFILSGSRIDFLSAMLALSASLLVLHDAKLKVRVSGALAIFVWAAVIGTLIGTARYTVHDSSLTFHPTIPIKMLVDATIPIKKLEDGVKGEVSMLYLSTIGDLGASVFQVVGLVQEQRERLKIM